MPKRLTLEDFITRARTVHGDKYDYSKVVYNNINSRVCILCEKHGEFIQRAEDHIRGNGCTKCGRLSCKETLLLKYGVDNPLKCKVIQDRVKQTNIIKYGSEYTFTASTISTKIQQTNLNRYGVINPLLSKKFQQKAHDTNLIRYGVTHASQHPDIKKRTAYNNTIKYGVPWVNQKHLINSIKLLQDYDWVYREYIIENKTAEQLAVELHTTGSTIIRYLKGHNIQIKHKTNYSRRAITWLESIIQTENIFIQHAKNIGEYVVPNTVYRVDGYCKDTNTIYEFYGDIWHGNPTLYQSHEKCNPFSKLTAGELYQKTVERENYILKLQYNLVTIWEYDYMGGKINAY